MSSPRHFLLIIFAVLAVAGFPNSNEEHNVSVLSQVIIHYVPSDLVDLLCRQMGVTNRKRMHGCSWRIGETCHVMMVKERNWKDFQAMIIKGHEISHCEGKEH